MLAKLYNMKSVTTFSCSHDCFIGYVDVSTPILYVIKTDMSELQAASSSSEVNVEMQNSGAKCDTFVEPEKKRMRILQNTDTTDIKHKLEDRLGGILCCAVCFDLPKTAVYQCSNGHLMCAGCFTHLLADARLREETATCPSCRTDISKVSATRNLAVEKAVSELPYECQFCGKQYPRNLLEKHETTQCEERIAGCKYHRIGCPWRGPFHESKEHESGCVHPKKSGAEVMDALQILDQQKAEEKKLFEYMFILLDYEKIIFNDVQLKPYRTEEFVHRLFYETSRFYAFNHQWVIKARVNNSQLDPTQSSERSMTYQVIMKTKTSTPLSIYFLILRGPFGDMKVKPKIYHFNFTEQENESSHGELPLVDASECNRLLSLKGINCRLLMFMTSK